jgi:hypothetical protein
MISRQPKHARSIVAIQKNSVIVRRVRLPRFFSRASDRILLGLSGIVSIVSYPALAFAAGGIQNPTSVGSVNEFIQKVLEAMVRLGIVVVALFILIAGFMYVAARGNAGKITEAHENFKYVIYGAILILGAWVIATIIGGTVTQILGA